MGSRGVSVSEDNVQEGLSSILWFFSMFAPPCINKFFFKRLGFGSAGVLQKLSLPCVARYG